MTGGSGVIFNAIGGIVDVIVDVIIDVIILDVIIGVISDEYRVNDG